MLHINRTVSNKGTAAQNKKPYTEPRLISRGDIATLTKGGGPVLLDAQGTQFGGGGFS